ncbi:MAG: DUF4019 domain-containing protein [Desulfobacterales bacterium]
MTPPGIVQDNVQLVAVSVKRKFEPNKSVELIRRRQAKLDYAVTGLPSPIGLGLRPSGCDPTGRRDKSIPKVAGQVVKHHLKGAKMRSQNTVRSDWTGRHCYRCRKVYRTIRPKIGGNRMKYTKILVVWGVTIVVLCFACRVTADVDKETAAVAAATAWLTLIDNGKYDDSWETAASYFKGAITKEYWQQTLTTVRKPLGKLVSRKIGSKTYAQSLPGAPDGEYVVIQFKTSFENKKSAVETVTPMLDDDGIWRVSGYYIK